jgi:hypothetical protein
MNDVKLIQNARHITWCFVQIELSVAKQKKKKKMKLRKYTRHFTQFFLSNLLRKSNYLRLPLTRMGVKLSHVTSRIIRLIYKFDVVEHSRLGWLAAHLECVIDVRKYFTVISKLDA